MIANKSLCENNSKLLLTNQSKYNLDLNYMHSNNNSCMKTLEFFNITNDVNEINSENLVNLYLLIFENIENVKLYF